ncbi:MAG: hypothetical protein JWO62_104 [Acidimicrobiaceae bacterium]|nr:hypothetical protein [Acidimicrobiaceae bacterium]
MHPIERLRYVARAGDVDPGLLAEEAALALAGLASEPRALVVAARRLIEFHPRCGPLWWVAARLLAANDLVSAAALAVAELEQDGSVEELAASFPGSAVVVSSPAPSILEAFGLRPDLDVRLVGEGRSLRSALRLLASDGERSGWLVEEAAEALEGAHLAVIEVSAAGPEGCVVDRGARTLAHEAARAGVPLWAVAGVGRILPSPLFAALAGRAGPDEVVAADELAGVVGPNGLMQPAEALGRSDCPVVLELTR